MNESSAGEYVCVATGATRETTRERLSLQVLCEYTHTHMHARMHTNSCTDTHRLTFVHTHTAGEGQPQFAFLQFSIVNSTRFSNIPNSIQFDTILQDIGTFVSFRLQIISSSTLVTRFSITSTDFFSD